MEDGRKNRPSMIKKQAFRVKNRPSMIKKQAFENFPTTPEFNTPTRDNIQRIFRQFNYERSFARADVMRVTGITATPASDLIRKMKTIGLIKLQKAAVNMYSRFRIRSKFHR